MCGCILTKALNNEVAARQGILNNSVSQIRLIGLCGGDLAQFGVLIHKQKL